MFKWQLQLRSHKLHKFTEFFLENWPTLQYWIENEIAQVTNYPKFLREIELYGRSNITQMEERIIDFPDNLQDFFDKNPEVRSWMEKLSFWQMSLSTILNQNVLGREQKLAVSIFYIVFLYPPRCARTTLSSPTPRTPRWRGTGSSSSPRGGRWTRFFLALTKRWWRSGEGGEGGGEGC